MMKNLRFIFIIVLVIAVLAIVKIKFFPVNTGQNMASQQGKPQVAQVTAYIVMHQKLDNRIFISGTLLSNEEVNLMPEVAGKITGIFFKEGERVKEGELLVKINDQDLQAQLKKLQLQEKLASEKEERQKKLLAINGISQEEYDATLTQLNSTAADIEVLKAQISKTQIIAPFDGTVGLKNISEGSYVTPGTQIAKIQQTDPMKLDFSIPEKYSSIVGKGDSIRFTLQGSEENFGGKIYAIEPKIEMSTRSVQLRGICSNKKGKLFPGAFAKIELLLKEIPNSILIPTEAIIPELKGQKVFLYKSGKAQPQKVETGIRTDTQIQITSGLLAGDTVITTGIMQLKPDALVNIMERK